MTLDDLDGMVKGRIIADGEYKRWWEGAKKALKPLRHILVPSKRTEPLILRESEAAAGEGLVEAFLKAKDLKGKAAALKAIASDLDLLGGDPGAVLEPVFKDLSAVVRMGAKYHLKEAFQLVLHRDEIIDTAGLAAIPDGAVRVEHLVSQFRDQLAEAVSGLAGSLLGRVYRSFPLAFNDGSWVDQCLAHLSKTGGKAVAEIATVLHAEGHEAVLSDFLRTAVRNRKASVELLIWSCKERKGLAASVFNLDLGNAVLDAMHADHLEGGPKRTGRLQEAFGEADLLTDMVAGADEQDVRLLAKRILGFNGLDELSRRSLMAKIIKQRPSLQDMVDEKAGAREDNTLIVSWESLERKKKELDEIISVKIPQNKKDIEIAREYGDLRENFEYKSAKQQQAVLQRMQGEYQRDIDRAQGTDFAGVNTQSVGIGTIVDLEDVPSGEKETFTILGAWDGDVEKGIISYLSEAAKVLIGRSVGDVVELPTDSAHLKRSARILAIRAFVG
jgi:transcription elongation GreA/GreB family factor